VNIKRAGSFTALLAAGALVLTGCATNESDEPTTPAEPGAEAPAGLSGTLVGAGASSIGAAMEGWIAEFQTANPDVTVNYDPSGSGAGRETFAGGGSAFAGSDRAFRTTELEEITFEACAPDSGIVQLPVYISPIAVIFNVDGIESLNMDADTIAGIFAGEITNWNDEAIASQNEGVDLPDLRITPVNRSDSSGTTENFVDYLAQAAPDVWTFEVSGDWPTELAAGEAAQGTSGVVDAVTNGTGTIGYADASRAGGLGQVSVLVGDTYVPFSPEAAAAVVDDSELQEGRADFDLTFDLNRNTADSGAYPIVLVAYLITCETFADSAQAELTQAFLRYVASDAGQANAAENAGSAPISATLSGQVNAAIDVIS
jgi:phosphate transport system substrate-binding protein